MMPILGGLSSQEIGQAVPTAPVTPQFSIIVPAHNAQQDLPACLEAIARQLTPDGEVIVIDDGSTDQTAEIAVRFGVRLGRISKAGGPSAARNLGAQLSSGEILVFVDADTVPAPGAIAGLVSALAANPEIDAVFGAYDTRPAAPQLVSQFRNLLHHFVHLQAQREASTFWTGCGAVRRDAFFRIGGFDATRRYLEDVDLGLRLKSTGGRIHLDPSIQAQHRKQWTLGSMVWTDIWGRAVPWMTLMHGRTQPRDHGARLTDQASAVLLAIGSACTLAGSWSLAAALLLASVLTAWRWHSFLVATRGAWFAVRALPLHWLYLSYCSVAFAGMLIYWYRPRISQRASFRWPRLTPLATRTLLPIEAGFPGDQTRPPRPRESEYGVQ